ncbi:MAG: hypothetical protein H8D26_03500 [Methanomicrobia archaeon]|nr:hypothetical protein [Methanomicrobia archaeon]
MPDVYDIRNIDFEFNFATNNLGVGGVVRSGAVGAGAAATNVPYVLDTSTILEVCGIQLIGPVNAGTGARMKLEHVKLVIGSDSYPHVVFNELMAPPINEFSPNIGPFFENGSKLCFNIGKPILAGGSPMDATPKVGPGKSLAVEVKAPVVGEGGLAINQDLIVRVTVAEVKGEGTARRILEHHGALTAAGDVRQSFELVDLERDLSVAHDKDVPFSLANWTKLHGGMDAATPRIWPFVSYAQNRAVTTPNDEYGMYNIGTRVSQDFMNFFWNYNEKEARRITHMGVLTHANLTETRIYKYGRSTNPWWTTNPTENELPLGLDPNAGTLVYQGPKALMRSRLIWQEKAEVQIKDNGAGATVPAWAAGVNGAMVAMWGRYYEM